MMRFFSIFSFILSFVFISGYTASALTVAPAITEVALDPGTSIEREVTVFNETAKEITVFARIESFVPRGDQGAAQTVNDGNEALRWLQLGQNVVTIAPGTAQTIPVLITVPKTAAVGGYYVAILWQQSSPASGGVTLNGRVGALLLITVKGDIKRSLSIDSFNVTSPGVRDPWQATIGVHNNGNVHIKPHGLLIVKNIFNRVVATVPINSEQGNVLPQSTRKFEIKELADPTSLLAMAQRLALIRATVYAEIEYNGGTTLMSDEQIIWTVTPTVIGLIAVVIFLIVVAGWLLINKIKRTRS